MPKERKVLVVDEDPLICWALEKALKKDGYEVSVSNTGEDAKGRLEKADFDMVIMDLNIRGMNGMDLLDDVRKRNPSTRIVLMTAFGSSRLKWRMAECGIYYITKPFQIEEFLNRIRRIFKSKLP